MKKDATFSRNMRYRYALIRIWDEGPIVNLIGLNPSVANKEEDDPTSRRCIGFAKSWGYSGIVMTNLFALVATDPKLMKEDHRPKQGRLCMYWLKHWAITADLVVAAWGVHGAFMNRGKIIRGVLEKITKLHVLGLTKHGHPKHPLYLPKDLKPIAW